MCPRAQPVTGFRISTSQAGSLTVPPYSFWATVSKLKLARRSSSSCTTPLRNRTEKASKRPSCKSAWRCSTLSTVVLQTVQTVLSLADWNITTALRPWKTYVQNPTFLASFALPILYLTVLSFALQMTTYLLTLGFTSTHVSLMRLTSIKLELSATCAAPWMMRRIGAVRSGLWFINEQLISIALAVGLFLYYNEKPMLAGAVLVSGVAMSRLGLWGFDLSVQYLVHEDAPEGTRGSFSSIEMSLQNMFELLSFATTMVFYRPEDFKIPI
jgi:hypothetical protein